MTSTDLNGLLAHLAPQLRPERWAFTTGDAAPDGALMTFRETEGITAIIGAQPDEPAFRCITLRVLSSLHAVGLTAAVSRALTDAHIPANVVAAFHHDHVFVPEADADRALAALLALARDAAQGRAPSD